jgi:hypothetical protein
LKQVPTKLKSEQAPEPKLFLKVGAGASAETNSFGSTTLLVNDSKYIFPLQLGVNYNSWGLMVDVRLFLKSDLWTIYLVKAKGPFHHIKST